MFSWNAETVPSFPSTVWSRASVSEALRSQSARGLGLTAFRRSVSSLFSVLCSMALQQSIKCIECLLKPIQFGLAQFGGK